jgi:hypothetical protein
MKKVHMSYKLLTLLLIATGTCLLFLSGCSRYARTVNTLYQPSATVRGGSGEVYVVIPESRQTNSPEIKWVVGTVKDDDNTIIDEVFSPRSPAEIIQDAFSQELRKAGYTVVPATKRPEAAERVLDLTKTVVELNQISDLADLKASCRVVVALDVFTKNQLIKRLQYESTSSKTDIKDRDMLARNTLEDALQSVMREAMPDLHRLFKQ